MDSRPRSNLSVSFERDSATGTEIFLSEGSATNEWISQNFSAAESDNSIRSESSIIVPLNIASASASPSDMLATPPRYTLSPLNMVIAIAALSESLVNPFRSRKPPRLSLSAIAASSLSSWRPPKLIPAVLRPRCLAMSTGKSLSELRSKKSSESASTLAASVVIDLNPSSLTVSGCSMNCSAISFVSINLASAFGSATIGKSCAPFEGSCAMVILSKNPNVKNKRNQPSIICFEVISTTLLE